MKHRIKKKMVYWHMDDEGIEKFEHMQKKRAENDENLKTSMISHLSALNDGVIAIFITVMMLEIPYPTTKDQYSTFIWSIITFLVSFFIIADFWYDNKRIFESIREADHLVIVADFIFLASLALIPATTKWIMHQADRYAAVNFGIVYFLTLLFQELLYYAALRKRFHNHFKLFFIILISHVGFLLVVNALLMVVAFFYPRWATVLYMVLPVISFFRPEKKEEV